MAVDLSTPWEPSRRQADLWIALLGVLVVALLLCRKDLERGAPVPVPERISSQGRLWELQQAARSFAAQSLPDLSQAAFNTKAPEAYHPWDKALMAILAAENGDLATARSLSMAIQVNKAGGAFHRCFSAAYLSSGESPSPEDRSRVAKSLRNGYAAMLLEARMQGTPEEARQMQQLALRWAMPRLFVLAAVGLVILLLAPSGIALALWLLFSSKRFEPATLPRFQLPGRVLVIVLLGWLSAFLLSSTIVGGLALGIPFLRPFAVPLTYTTHAILGLVFLCRAEGISASGLARRLVPGANARSLLWGLGFLSLAVVMVFSVSLVVGSTLRPQEPPQQQLMDVVAATKGVLPLSLLVLTISALAPIFEECFFRGTLLSWLGHHMEGKLGRYPGWIAALLISSLAFGLIHLQPTALPVLSTLGLTLGLSLVRTGNLLTPILVHGFWNGGVFLFYRLVLG